MKPFLNALSCAAVVLCGAMTAQAHTEGAHVHGEGQVAIIADGETVKVSLNSAMYNIVGFERAPANEAETDALNDAIMAIKDGAALFRFNEAASCSFEGVTHSLPEDVTAEPSEGKNPFRDLEAEYTFMCAAPDRLMKVTINAFEAFERLEKIDLIVFNQDDQSAATATRDERVFTFVN